ncbi:hypothetical protein NKI12_02305 [Mesorhizobium australicum]|uniref:Uncharacterized protein n=1 Tax=Mesorhizobium australicum TaxID=536018 RepID=A0ACC6SVH8_9HYPH
MEHVIKLTDEQLNLVGAGLAELPFKLAQPVIVAIHQQLAAGVQVAKENEAEHATSDQKSAKAKISV